MLLTQPKIASLTPHWAPFAGFSLMLEADPAVHAGPKAGMFASTDSASTVYNRIKTALATIGVEALMRDLLLALLPAETWHVTFADLLHDGLLAKALPMHQGAIALALADAPSARLPEILRAAGVTAGVNRPARVRLAYQGFSTLSGSVAALTFTPASDEDRAALDDLLAWRHRILTQLAPITGQPPRDWVPHLTIGYFLNRSLAAQEHTSLDRLGSALDTALTGLALEYDAVSLFSFISMVDFRRVVLD
jgi:hypothetical protein